LEKSSSHRRRSREEEQHETARQQRYQRQRQRQEEEEQSPQEEGGQRGAARGWTMEEPLNSSAVGLLAMFSKNGAAVTPHLLATTPGRAWEP
jgi:hypothetical protein